LKIFSYFFKKKKDTSAEFEYLKSDVAELNQILKISERQSVKEVISTEVNTNSAKITSLYQIIRDADIHNYSM
jgi:hypothetical protein